MKSQKIKSSRAGLFPKHTAAGDLAAEIGPPVGGWFQNEGEAVRLAVVEFIRRHQAVLIDRFQREDINWAVSQANDIHPDRREP